MKKILLAIAFVMMMVVGANAQTDGYFSSSSENYSNRGGESTPPEIAMPQHLQNGDQGAPLGTGLIILSALGAGYAVARRKR